MEFLISFCIIAKSGNGKIMEVAHDPRPMKSIQNFISETNPFFDAHRIQMPRRTGSTGQLRKLEG
jgi:hypothetical protein